MTIDQSWEYDEDTHSYRPEISAERYSRADSSDVADLSWKLAVLVQALEEIADLAGAVKMMNESVTQLVVEKARAAIERAQGTVGGPAGVGSTIELE